MTYLSVLKDKRLQKLVAKPRFRRHAFAAVHRVCGFFQPRPIVQDNTGVNGLQVVLVRGGVCDHPEGLLFLLLLLLLQMEKDCFSGQLDPPLAPTILLLFLTGWTNLQKKTGWLFFGEESHCIKSLL